MGGERQSICCRSCTPDAVGGICSIVESTDELSEHIQELCSYTSHEPTNTDELIQGSSKRSRQLTSLIWKEFDILYVEPDGSQRAQCKWCKRDYACGGTTGTSNLWRHLSNGVTASEDEEDRERLSIDFAPLVAKLTNLHVGGFQQ